MKRKKRFMLIILGIFTVLTIPIITWSVCHNDAQCENLRQHLITGYKWAKDPYEVAVTYYINPTVDPTASITTDTIAGADIWTNARYNGQDPKFRLRYGGTTSNNPSLVNADGVNVVGFGPIDQEGPSIGQLIRALKLGHKEAGYYIEKPKAAYWDGKNEAGEKVSSGVYFYQLQAGQFISNRKMVILK